MLIILPIMLCCTAQKFTYYALINAQYYLLCSIMLNVQFDDCSIRVTDCSIRVYRSYFAIVIFPARVYTIIQIFNLLCWHYAQCF